MMSERPLPTTILHPTSLRDEDLTSFQHATALAAAANARLVSFHAAPDGGDVDLPDANLALEAWGSASRVEQQRITRLYADDLTESMLFAASEAKPDLIVATTHLRPEWQRWMREGIPETVAHLTHIPLLYLPIGGHGIIDPATGRFTLRHIIIAAESAEVAMLATRWAAWLMQLVGGAGVVTILHVGDPAALHTTIMPEIPGWQWAIASATPGQLSLEEHIARAVDHERDALLIMPTRSRDSLGDALFGTHTERVLHRIHAPLLSIPIGD